MDRDFVSGIHAAARTRDTLSTMMREKAELIKRTHAVAVVLVALFAGVPAMAAQQQVFGPKQYDVIERYGKENRYSETFKAGEGLYLVKIQNGERPPERVDLMEFSINGKKLLRDDRYEYRFIACFAALQKENFFELVLKDRKPVGSKRPPPVPKFVTITIMPAPIKAPEGAFGLNSWRGLKDYIGGIQKIKAPESMSLAVSAASLQNDIAVRSEAMRGLSDRKDVSSQDFILRIYNDFRDQPNVRAEAALALGKLGDKSMVPVLMNGVLDANETIRIGSTRALSLYREEDTHESLSTMIGKLDPWRKDAVLRALASAGWRPVGTLKDMAESSDIHVANTAIELLGGLEGPAETEFLLKLLENPGGKDTKVIIAALGISRDRRAVEPLLLIARDPKKRRGREAALGTALADLGDPRAAGVIKDMARDLATSPDYDILFYAYMKLTGKELK